MGVPNLRRAGQLHRNGGRMRPLRILLIILIIDLIVWEVTTLILTSY